MAAWRGGRVTAAGWAAAVAVRGGVEVGLAARWHRMGAARCSLLDVAGDCCGRGDDGGGSGH
jgi:hypothetical protein